ncbi:gamma-glutamyltransferase [Robbsia sp. KACC 23696]|uniref:gamma-glutamyltransferase family protein n=1 Tax=Robbsia sp. KACC 23696 TaxID=3149231 RepID=UPI00325A4F4E
MTAAATAIASLVALFAAPPAFAKRAPTPSLLDSAAAAVPNRYAASAVEQVLRQGGNAVDAAVTAGFVLAVTSPDTAGLGGGGFMTLYMGNQPYFLDFRERAPQGAIPGMFLDAKGKVVAGASEVGGRAAAVPGSVAGLWEAQKRFGKLKWAQVLAPAIQLARDGFDVDEPLAQRLSKAGPRFNGKTNFSVYFADLHAGSHLRQPELAATLQQLADNGGNAFYSGHVADLLAEAMRGHGLITQSDLSDYQAKWRAPLVAPWHGYQIITASAPSVGGLALVQMLRLREGLQSAFDGVGPDTPQYAQLTAAIAERVDADQHRYPGDPDSAAASDGSGGAQSAARWIGADYIKRQATEIAASTKAKADVEAGTAAAAAGASAASGAAASGAVAGAASSADAASGASVATPASSASALGTAPAPAPASAAAAAATASAPVSTKAHPSAGTQSAGAKPAEEPARAISTQYAIVDRWGNAVSVSMTMNAPFGSGVVVPGAGFLLNDAMDGFASTGEDAGTAKADGRDPAQSQSGAHGNAIAGGRRPVSPMAPTILTDGGKAILALDAGGAGRPDSLQGPLVEYLVITSIVHDKQPLAQAVSGPTTSGADVQAVQVQGDAPVPQADPRGRGVATVVK